MVDLAQQQSRRPLPVNVVKVGGAVVEDSGRLEGLLRAFASLEGAKALVHGGGRTATDMAARLGLPTRMVAGRRVTDEAMLRVVTMVYAGLVNKNVVARLAALGLPALGLTGADLDILRSHRRPPVSVRLPEAAEPSVVDYGFVGDVDRADGARLAALAGQGIVPVLAPLTHDGRGQLLNTNADTIASTAARALAQAGCRVTLTYCFEHAGVLARPDDEASVIARITPSDFELLQADGTVSGGMVPKIQNALQACREGVDRVVITSAEALGHPDAGTVISL